MIDILITTYNRVEFLRCTVQSLIELNSIDKRIFIIDDCSNDGTQDYLRDLTVSDLAFVCLSKQRNGVVYGFNMLWNMIEYWNSFYEEFPYMMYLQDDMESKEKDWIGVLIGMYERLRNEHKIGFCTGYDAIEHPVIKYIDMGREVQIKRSTSATNLLAEKSFWRSIGYVPKFNPDGTSRGFPGGGKGSHIDLYLTGCMSGGQYVERASAKNSSFNQGKQILVVPGLLNHLGVDGAVSTWRRDKVSA